MRIPAFLLAAILSLLVGVRPAAAQSASARPAELAEEQKMLAGLHSISSHRLLEYVRELASERYGGRLTGTPEYDACAAWAASLLGRWGVRPAGDAGTYFQEFPNPYTLVLPGCEACLRLPQGRDTIKRYYRYEDEFIPGATSGSGEVTAEVVYVGYGVTAPELGYDDYAGIDVAGRIVLLEPEVPVSPGTDAELFKKWRPYSFHQRKLKNAVSHGAKGMIYNYGPIVNPNNAYVAGFVYSHVGDAVVTDVFAGTDRRHDEVIGKIRKTLKPQSFATGKIFSLKNITEHHPDGTGRNVAGFLQGTDPGLRDEVIILSAHLDGQGRCYSLMPGANDNASGTAVVLGVAEALAKGAVRPRRTVVFILFGAEEQGVAGSDYYVSHPLFPLERTAAVINLESSGVGDKINVAAADNFPELWGFICRANGRYIHRVVTPSFDSFPGRPRQDTARFFWKGVPSVTVDAAESAPSNRPSSYHNSRDNLDLITPEIMEDIAQLLFVAVLDMSRRDTLNFRK